MEALVITVFGKDETISQDVRVTFWLDFEPSQNLYEEPGLGWERRTRGTWYIVDARIEEPLDFEPSDIAIDLEIAIADQMEHIMEWHNVQLRKPVTYQVLQPVA